jgi:hypothetical protein
MRETISSAEERAALKLAQAIIEPSKLCFGNMKPPRKRDPRQIRWASYAQFKEAMGMVKQSAREGRRLTLRQAHAELCRKKP